MNKQDMLQLKNWAIVGATPKTDRFGYKIWKLMPERGYTVYGVNARSSEIEGIPLYASLEEIDAPIDVVNMIVNPKVALDILPSIKDLGIQNVFFQPGSFDEAVLQKAEELGLHVVADECVYRELKDSGFLFKE